MTTTRKKRDGFMARCRSDDGRRIQQMSAKRLISQADFLHVMLNVWEGLDEDDQQEAIRAAGEKRAVKYGSKTAHTDGAVTDVLPTST